MKTLTKQTLIYDEECPLCNAYTSGFIKTGMLDKSGRKPFSALTDEERECIDCERAVNEIALFNRDAKTVTYGIDSLIAVIGHSFPLVKKISGILLIKLLLSKLYFFISYNRKVIIPGKSNSNAEMACIPAFNYLYRVTYIIFAAIITSIVLFHYANALKILPNAGFHRELGIALGQILFQGIFIYKKDSKAIVNYFGNLMTVSLAGSLLLIPLLILDSIFGLSQVILLPWFVLTAFLMFLEHSRRVRLLALPYFMSITWAAYRLIILVLILN